VPDTARCGSGRDVVYVDKVDEIVGGGCDRVVP
jgi:hypothetical protein